MTRVSHNLVLDGGGGNTGEKGRRHGWQQLWNKWQSNIVVNYLWLLISIIRSASCPNHDNLHHHHEQQQQHGFIPFRHQHHDHPPPERLVQCGKCHRISDLRGEYRGWTSVLLRFQFTVQKSPVTIKAEEQRMDRHPESYLSITKAKHRKCCCPGPAPEAEMGYCYLAIHLRESFQKLAFWFIPFAVSKLEQFTG